MLLETCFATNLPEPSAFVGDAVVVVKRRAWYFRLNEAEEGAFLACCLPPTAAISLPVAEGAEVADGVKPRSFSFRCCFFDLLSALENVVVGDVVVVVVVKKVYPFGRWVRKRLNLEVVANSTSPPFVEAAADDDELVDVMIVVATGCSPPKVMAVLEGSVELSS